MKRSSAVEVLRQSIIHNIEDIYLSISLDEVSKVLDDLEGLGMSPPEYLPEPQHHDNGKQLEVKPVRKWENE